MLQGVEDGREGYGDGASYIYDNMFPALLSAKLHNYFNLSSSKFCCTVKSTKNWFLYFSLVCHLLAIQENVQFWMTEQCHPALGSFAWLVGAVDDISLLLSLHAGFIHRIEQLVLALLVLGAAETISLRGASSNTEGIWSISPSLASLTKMLILGDGDEE